MRGVILLGASGSIGKQTLSLLEAYPDRYRLIGLSVHQQVEAVLPWVEKLRPEWLCITDATTYAVWQNRNGYPFSIIPSSALSEVLSSTSADIVLNAISGAAGFLASYATLQNPRPYLALANKESLVFGGKWLAPYRQRIIPVDSEHSAIF
ncbi:MAG: 1-deoxy-D-xylulose-5-phosphate reductoisomerase, partial [Bacteroidia bacterium]|nr:1-deoxy-D-xylulose-5-phosphate reductoisomerase [Bacteroidia bacterium]